MPSPKQAPVLLKGPLLFAARRHCHMVSELDEMMALMPEADPAAAWQAVAVEDWDERTWGAFLRCLTPRQLVYQMRAWCLLAKGAPELATEFAEACAEVRRLLWQTECVSG